MLSLGYQCCIVRQTCLLISPIMPGRDWKVAMGWNFCFPVIDCQMGGVWKTFSVLDLLWPLYFILVQQKESIGFRWRGWLLNTTVRLPNKQLGQRQQLSGRMQNLKMFTFLYFFFLIYINMYKGQQMNLSCKIHLRRGFYNLNFCSISGLSNVELSTAWVAWKLLPLTQCVSYTFSTSTPLTCCYWRYGNMRI